MQQDSDSDGIIFPLTKSAMEDLYEESKETMQYIQFDDSELFDLNEPDELKLLSESATSRIPNTVEYSGKFNFHIEVEMKPWMELVAYSEKLKKVYAEIEKMIPIQVSCNFYAHQDLWIRAVLISNTPETIHIPITQCIVHRETTETDLKDHMIRCKDRSSIYEYNPESERYSVKTPLTMPQAGTSSVELIYSFHCKTSCQKQDRKNTAVIFTLENSKGLVLGRQVLNFTICACPHRDKTKEEAKTLKRKSGSNNHSRQSKRIKEDPENIGWKTVSLTIYPNMIGVLKQFCQFLNVKRAFDEGRPFNEMEKQANAHNEQELDRLSSLT